MIKFHPSIIFCYFLVARIVLHIYLFLYIFMGNDPCITLTKSADKFTGRNSARFGSSVFAECTAVFNKLLSPLLVPHLDKTESCPYFNTLSNKGENSKCFYIHSHQLLPSKNCTTKDKKRLSFLIHLASKILILTLPTYMRVVLIHFLTHC